MNDLPQNPQSNIGAVIRCTSNLEIAIKYYQYLEKDESFKGKISLNDVIKTLHFLKQCNEDELDLIGIGYKRLDGGDLKDCSVKNMYEGGFLVRID